MTRRTPEGDIEEAAARKGPFKRRSSIGATNPLDGHRLHQARRETSIVTALRIAVLILLIVATSCVAALVYRYLRDQESADFANEVDHGASKILTSFLNAVTKNLGAIDTMSSRITSYALDQGLGFPNVTLPDFEVQGSLLRVQEGAAAVHWMPLVTNENRLAWEEYAYEHREQIDRAYDRDRIYRERQDALFGIVLDDSEHDLLNGGGATGPKDNNTLNDDSGFHPRIWQNGAVGPRGDQPEGAGPFFPLWQRSPINDQKQGLLNLNFAQTKPLLGSMDAILGGKKAVMTRAAVPIPRIAASFAKNLRLGQYRESIDDYLWDPSTFIVYPVFDTFEAHHEVVGGILVNIYWKVLFESLILPGDGGFVCVLENSFNQSFSYRLDQDATSFLGMEDFHDRKYDNYMHSVDMNQYLKNTAGPTRRAYTTVGLNEEYGTYRIRVYPSPEMEDKYRSNKPYVYTMIIVGIFFFTSMVFILYSFVVEKRQRLMMEINVENAEKAASAERELNEFISHEVRNPLSAAISATSFVSSAVNESGDFPNSTQVKEDMGVITSSLHFINDFLRSMLDIQRADLRCLKLNLAPTNIRTDVFEPVAAMLHTRDSNFEVQVECPESLYVVTDHLRLKQVVLNLARNSSKFVQRGFVRMRVSVEEDGEIVLFVEDSGPGIPQEKREELFSKYQSSLDSLSQGTGVGLCLSKTLMEAMGGTLVLDEEYRSGLDGCPGACFVLRLQKSRHVEEKGQDGGSDCPTSEETRDQDGLVTSPIREMEIQEELSALLVDDDPILRRLFVRAIRKARPSWVVEEAANGESALERCQQETFDLIFVDQYMASVDKQLLGTETIRQMRSNGVQSVICGLSANDLEAVFLQAGANTFLLKPLPCKLEDTNRALNKILQKRGRISNEEKAET